MDAFLLAAGALRHFLPSWNHGRQWYGERDLLQGVNEMLASTSSSTVVPQQRRCFYEGGAATGGGYGDAIIGSRRCYRRRTRMLLNRGDVATGMMTVMPAMLPCTAGDATVGGRRCCKTGALPLQGAADDAIEGSKHCYRR